MVPLISEGFVGGIRAILAVEAQLCAPKRAAGPRLTKNTWVYSTGWAFLSHIQVTNKEHKRRLVVGFFFFLSLRKGRTTNTLEIELERISRWGGDSACLLFSFSSQAPGFKAIITGSLQLFYLLPTSVMTRTWHVRYWICLSFRLIGPYKGYKSNKCGSPTFYII